jgi:phosphoribosylamine--glycine ligase
VESFQDLADRARARGIDLVVVGPDDPLSLGIVDVLKKNGLTVFGPTRAASQLEWSKGFAKQILRDTDAPTARGVWVKTIQEAERFLSSVAWPGTPGSGWVIKADGLALGKGVVVCETYEQALQAATHLISVSGSLVIEERLVGEELSWIAICDGTDFRMLEPARDHKRLRDGDQGPNTGGMGAFSPVPGVTENLREKIKSQVFTPVLKAMRDRGASFVGALYAGLMWNPKTDQFWVIEFNARFGDPEAQVLLPRIEGSLFQILDRAARGQLSEIGEIPMSSQTHIAVVLASPGYPESPRVGEELGALDRYRAPDYFMAGVKFAQNQKSLVSSGGRVLAVHAQGANLQQARDSVYPRIQALALEWAHYRRDIGSPESGFTSKVSSP